MPAARSVAERAIMRSLADIQAAFIRAIVADDSAEISGIVSAYGIAPAQRLQIYRNNFLISLAGALAATFPVLQKLVGEAYFDRAARRFSAEEPPRVAMLAHYGEAFPAFLAGLTASADFAYLTDVGALEWAINHAFHADDAMPEDAAAFDGIPATLQGELVLAPHPSARLVSSSFPILDIWRANQPDADPTLTIDLGSGSVSLLVWRRDLDVVWRVLEPAEAAFVAAILDMQTLAQAARLAAAQVPHHEFDAGGFCAELLASGLFIGHLLPAHS